MARLWMAEDTPARQGQWNAMQRETQGEENSPDMPQRGADDLCETFIYRMAIFGYYDEAKFQQSIEEFGLQSPGYRLGVIEVSEAVKQPGYRQYDTRRLLQAHLRAQLQPACRFYLADYQLGSFLLLLCYEEESGLLGQVESALSQMGGRVWVGVSATFARFADITGALQQAQHALERRFYAARGLVFLYESPALRYPAPEMTKNLYFEKILQTVADCAPGLFVHELEEFAAALVRKYQGVSGGADECRKICIELAALLLSEVQKTALSANQVLGSSFPYVPILYAAGIQDIKAILLSLGLHCIKQLEGMRAAHPDHTVAIIMDYLSQNYAEKISLNQVAEQVYMNASYVSRLLKKATGKTFTDLLLEVRIEKAKELLRGATKVYEVGELVGIENPKYFSQVFKKHTGATPSEFRGAESAEANYYRLAE